MTDTFIIDEHGEFVVGKAQTTPEDESLGFMASARDALAYWDQEVEETFPLLRSGIYSGTAMLNRLLERKGRRVGCVVTAGMEDYLRQERAIQTYLGYSYSDRLHLVTHRHNEPLVPRETDEGRPAAGSTRSGPRSSRSTKARRARRSATCWRTTWRRSSSNLIYSYRNPAHEARVREIAHEVMEEAGREVPVYLSSELYPLRQDFPRLNATLLEAYAAEPSRGQLQKVRDVTRQSGAGVRLADHGEPRGDDLDRRERARADHDLRPHRRRDRGKVPRQPRGHAERGLHRHRRHLVRHRARDRRGVPDQEHPERGPDAPQRPARPDRLGRGPGPARTSASTRRTTGSRSGPTRPARRSACATPTAASTRSRSPTATSSSGPSTPTTSSAATSRSTPSAPRPPSASRSPSRWGSTSTGRRRAWSSCSRTSSKTPCSARSSGRATGRRTTRS